MNHFSSRGGDGGEEEDFEGVLRGSGRQQRGLQLEQVGRKEGAAFILEGYYVGKSRLL